MKTKYIGMFLVVAFCVFPYITHADEEPLIIQDSVVVPVDTIEPSVPPVVIEATPDPILVPDVVSEPLPIPSLASDTVPDPLPIPVPVQTETILIRNGDTVLYEGHIDFPNEGTLTIVDDTGTPHEVNARSVLGILSIIDTASDSFSISDIQYYTSFNALYLKCIRTGDELCDNWQYVVNGTIPSTGIDSTLVLGGETIGLFFGSSHRVRVSSQSVLVNDTFVATAEKYNYLDNSWGPLVGVSIGVTAPNTSDPWNPIVLTSQSVDTDGHATLLISSTGTFTIGIVEDYYFPSYSIEVNPVPVQPVSERGSSSGSGGGVIISNTADISKAIAFLVTSQKQNGSFEESEMYTDWAAMALSSTTELTATQKVLDYMRLHNSISTQLTDSERRSMALLSLGQNPYDFYGRNYIEKIIQSFDGIQFGDNALVNDDIFALIPLSKAGYSSNDEIISKDVAFLLSRQEGNGSWSGSIDLTAAAIQALFQYSSISGVSESMQKANMYVQNAQQEDGGWGNISTTSWVVQAMYIQHLDWVKNGKTPVDYFASQQVGDGAFISSDQLSSSRIWATSYAIPALFNKPWRELLNQVERPHPVVSVVLDTKSIELVQNPENIVIVSATVSAPVSVQEIPVIVLSDSTHDLPLEQATQEEAEISRLPMVSEVVLFEKKAPEDNSLTAAAGAKNTNIPISVFVGSLISIVGIGFLARRYSTHK